MEPTVDIRDNEVREDIMSDVPEAVVVEFDTAQEDSASKEGADINPTSDAKGPAEERRSAWRVLSSEDMPQVSLREILGGDFLIGSFFRRQIWFILMLVIMSVLYITNRYAAQQEIVEEERLRKVLVEKKNYALTRYCELTRASRQSTIEQQLKALGDSTLKSSKEPPFIIRVNH